jgi:hypothetical protein
MTPADQNLDASMGDSAEPDEAQKKHLHMVVRLLPKDKNKFLARLGAYSPKKVDIPRSGDVLLLTFGAHPA